jgi:hypothetical protein
LTSPPAQALVAVIPGVTDASAGRPSGQDVVDGDRAERLAADL